MLGTVLFNTPRCLHLGVFFKNGGYYTARYTTSDMSAKKIAM